MDIYIIAPPERLTWVDTELRPQIEKKGHVVLSNRESHSTPKGIALTSLPLDDVRRLIINEDGNVHEADVVWVLVDNDRDLGGELHSSARLAFELGVPVFWIGEATGFPLSAFRTGSSRFTSVSQALDALELLSCT